MIRIVMFDVGDTLVRAADRRPFPHVLEALRAIAAFTTPAGEPLERCLVSDFPAALPVPADRRAPVLDEFLGLLPPELTALFRPAERRVTLSAHAGVAQPDPRIFTTAIKRLGLRAGLDECLILTEQPDHVARCRQMGMAALQFGGHATPPPAGTDFTDWADAPALVAHAVDPSERGSANLEAAVRAHLAASHPHLEAVSLQPAGLGGGYHVRAQTLVPLDDPGLGDLDGVHVPLTVSGLLRLGGAGRVLGLEGAEPDPEEIAEAHQMVKGLAATGQVKTPHGPPGLGATHEVIVDDRGRRVLCRKRFTAL